VHANPNEDPFLHDTVDSSDEDEDFLIKPTDNLLVVGKTMLVCGNLLKGFLNFLQKYSG